MVFCDRRVNRVCVLQFLKGPLARRAIDYTPMAPNNNLTGSSTIYYTVIRNVYYIPIQEQWEQKWKKNLKYDVEFVFIIITLAYRYTYILLLQWWRPISDNIPIITAMYARTLLALFERIQTHGKNIIYYIIVSVQLYYVNRVTNRRKYAV